MPSLSIIGDVATSGLCEGEATTVEDLEAVEETAFPSSVVLRMQWRRGDACIWNNETVTHSRTPAALYADGGAEDRAPRKMLQIVQHWTADRPATLYPKAGERAAPESPCAQP